MMIEWTAVILLGVGQLLLAFAVIWNTWRIGKLERGRR